MAKPGTLNPKFYVRVIVPEQPSKKGGEWMLRLIQDLSPFNSVIQPQEVGWFMVIVIGGIAVASIRKLRSLAKN